MLNKALYSSLEMFTLLIRRSGRMLRKKNIGARCRIISTDS